MERGEIIPEILLLIVSLVVSGFLVTRAYLLVSKGELDVKGAIYSRRATPIHYWIVLASAVVGIVMTLLIAGLCIFDLLVSV